MMAKAGHEMHVKVIPDMSEVDKAIAAQKPSVGRIVHYRTRGSGDGVHPALCFAAIVTDVREDSVDLATFGPSGLRFEHTVEHDKGGETIGNLECPDKASHGAPFRYCQCGWIEAHYQGGTWHWPERV